MIHVLITDSSRKVIAKKLVYILGLVCFAHISQMDEPGPAAQSVLDDFDWGGSCGLLAEL